MVRAGHRTPTKTRILGGGKHSIKQQIVRYDIEQPLTLTAADRQRFETQLGRWAGAARVAVLSDYGYGAVEPALPAGGAAARCSPGARCSATAASGWSEFRGLDGATPNEEEAEALLGERAGRRRRAARRAAGSALRARLGARFLLVTRGSRGMALFHDGAAAHLPVHGTDQVADVTGAGDTVIGTFALALAAGATPLEAALLANYAGGIVVMKMGTATLTRGELEAAVRLDPRPLRELQWAKS